MNRIVETVDRVNARIPSSVTPATRIVTDEVERLRAENEALRNLLIRYRTETPLGHQPHMIAHLVDEALRGES